MSKTLRFSATTVDSGTAKKNDNVKPPGSGPLSVIEVRLPSGEDLPFLVQSTTWEPVSLALRWAVLARRTECAASTLRGNLDALRSLYAWGEARFPEGIEARLTTSPLVHEDLLDLKEYLRRPQPAHQREAADDVVESPAAGARALAAKLFLTWALSPASRNERGAGAPGLVEAKAQIDGVLGPLAARAGKGRERPTPDEALLDAAEDALRPAMDADGRFLRPLVWSRSNPFRRGTRLRNWVMWCLARDCGLRIGEILSLRNDDVITRGGVTYVRVLRRPDNKEDPRRRPPAVKTRSRLLPLSPYGTFAVQAYLREPAPLGRRRGSPFLVAGTHGGRPLGKTAAARVAVLLSIVAEGHLSWHDLRHAWATDFARGVLMNVREGGLPTAPDEQAMLALLSASLRELGGWSETSKEPLYYARAAIREAAMRMLARVQEARARRAAAAWKARTEQSVHDQTPPWMMPEEDGLPW